MSGHSIAIVSDVHAGSTVAVCPQDVELDDGGSYHASDAQCWLYDHWDEHWKWVKQNVPKRNKLTVLVNGDLFDGDHHDTSQIVSRHPGMQFAIAQHLFKPILDLKPDFVIFVRGTESHVGKSGSNEEGFARWVAEQGVPVIRDPDTGNHAWWHFRGDFGPLRLDAAHHGRIGTRPSTKYNAVLAQACDIFTSHAANGERHPDLVVRGHVHTYGDSHDAYPTRVIQLPAWQLKTGFGHRVAADKLSDIGGILLNVEDQDTLDVEVRKRIIQPSRGTIWLAP